MVDNPRVFILSVVVLILILATIIFGVGFFGNTSNKTGVGSQDENGASTTTATPKPRPTTKNAGTGVVVYDTVINYTDSGFIPNTAEVKAGTSVRFINKSNAAMRISVIEQPGQERYSEFAQSSSLGKGGTFDFNFSKRGIWLYHNLNDKSKTGVVVVK